MKKITIIIIVLILIIFSISIDDFFNQYRVTLYKDDLLSLNTEISTKEAVMFRTAINEKLSQTGINFAGKYSLVYVGMTGWGQNYFLVDRTNGKAMSVLFSIDEIDTKSDSSLLKFTFDNKTYKYSWSGNEFIQLGNPAPINPFWKEYFE